MKVVAAVFAMVSFLFFFQIHPNYTNPNELSRLLLVSSIVDDHSFCIDQAIKRYGDTEDKSVYLGKFYCDKPIGYSILAVPFYWVLRLFIEPDAGPGFFLYVLRIFINLIPLLLFVIFFHKCLTNHLNLQKTSYFFTVALVFGSLLYPFGQLFLSHILTAVCVYVGFCLCCHYTERRYSFFAGAILGFGFLLEFPVMIAIGAFFVWMIFKKKSNVALFLIGVLLIVSFQFIYNYAVFDDPFGWPQMHMAPKDVRTAYSTGYAGFVMPSYSAFWGLTFGSVRGLFFFVPHLIFGVIGLVQHRNRSEALLILSIIVLSILYYSGFILWDGGQSFGPRYLVFLIPLLVYGSAILFRDLLKSANPKTENILFALYVACVAFTIPNMLFGTVTYPYPPRFLENPALWLNITLFWRGFFGLNWGEYLGMSLTMIQIVAIVLLLVPSVFFLHQSGLTKKYQALFVLIIIGFIAFSKIIQPIIQAKTPGTECFAIGRIGYIQGNYDRSIEFLNYARQRSPNTPIDNVSKDLLLYIQKEHQRSLSDR